MQVGAATGERNRLVSGIAIGALAIAFVALIASTALYRARAKRADRRFQILDDIAAVADGGRSLEQTLEIGRASCRERVSECV